MRFDDSVEEAAPPMYQSEEAEPPTERSMDRFAGRGGTAFKEIYVSMIQSEEAEPS
jgi:hypothetical protein